MTSAEQLFGNKPRSKPMDKLIGTACDAMGGLYRSTGAIVQLRRSESPKSRRLGNTIQLADLAERTRARIEFQEQLRQGPARRDPRGLR